MTRETPTLRDDERLADPRRAYEIYDRMRADIVHGVLRPNEPLIETELAERLGVSRTPIRETLQRLATDGLIVYRRRRWYVYEHTAAEIQELYEIRAAQEGYAARLASERATADQLEQISAAATAVDQTTADDRVLANEAFHDLINEASGNKRLVELIAKTRLFHFNFRLAGVYTADELGRSSGQHAEIVAAVTARDGALAETVVRSHILEAAAIARRIGR
ncbi:MAG: GntR family transcriptional regulator [Nocardioidaceae bacterium]